MIYLLFFFLSLFQITKTIPDSAQYFLDTKKLYNIEQTQQELFKHGFKKISLTTHDNIKLSTLFLDKSKKEKVEGTILYCAGFYPGLKEGMCSFYSLIIDQPYNVLVFDARGHSESEGNFLTYQGLKNYGKHEYLDILAALDFINSYNKKNNLDTDIVIHGICSGAFHSIKAVNYLQKNAPEESKKIKGIIFDSGWFHLSDIVKSSIHAEISKKLSHGWFSWAVKPLSYITYQFYNLFFAKEHSKQEGIYESIQTITCPIFFVHCTKDPYISIDPVQKFTEQCNCKYFWWIPHDGHANYHMTNYESYKEKLLYFLDNALN